MFILLGVVILIGDYLPHLPTISFNPNQNVGFYYEVESPYIKPFHDGVGNTALIDGIIRQYDVCGNSKDSYKEYPQYTYIGEGVIYSIKGIRQNFTEKEHFFIRGGRQYWLRIEPKINQSGDTHEYSKKGGCNE